MFCEQCLEILLIFEKGLRVFICSGPHKVYSQCWQRSYSRNGYHHSISQCRPLSQDWRFAPPWTGPPGSSVHGISQARVLEWVVIPFSRGSSWPRDWTRISCIAGAARETHYYQYLMRKCFILWVSISEVAIWKTRKKKKRQMGRRERKKISCMNSKARKAGTIAFSKMLSDIFSRGD